MSFPSWLSRLAALTLAVVLAAGLARLALVPLLWRDAADGMALAALARARALAATVPPVQAELAQLSPTADGPERFDDSGEAVPGRLRDHAAALAAAGGGRVVAVEPLADGVGPDGRVEARLVLSGRLSALLATVRALEGGRPAVVIRRAEWRVAGAGDDPLLSAVLTLTVWGRAP